MLHDFLETNNRYLSCSVVLMAHTWLWHICILKVADASLSILSKAPAVENVLRGKGQRVVTTSCDLSNFFSGEEADQRRT